MDTEYTRNIHMMRSLSDCGSSATYESEEQHMVMKKGPWTKDEDSVLINYVNVHGEGHWNSIASITGLKRTGKSCRLRWLNYLHPNVRRGNITLHEQLLILDLHSRWGNRWSKIAEELPGRTDNEIKNYWRTRVLKQAKQLKCDVNSKQFRDTMRFVWMPRLMEQIQASSSHGHGQSTMCSNSQAHTEPCVTISTPCILQQKDYSKVQEVEPSNDFGGADLWTDENICFLQQLLADD